ncbi:MFS transporter [Paenibacillus sp. J31TS4]|uniref:MFS transporter n=1 Tax=Paenibacillus sp. J31TS4 TaxID=2807195 RepID=UPI001B1A7086|nr:MFS transporter [Paenibacillus sp. J31TS4]GIP37250.1 MFS transporter [Paenibacillus sp. J31TS4]
MAYLKNRWQVLQIVNMGTFMSTLDVGIVNVTLPTMAAQFSVSLAQVQWVVTSYLLTMVALLPILGKWSDRTDRSKVYSYGFLVFAAGSLFCALSGSLAALIVSRVVQGAGASMILSNSQAMVRKLFPNEESGRALAMNAVVISLGTLAGPAVGGLLLELADWAWLFLINVPIGAAALVLGLRLFPKDEKRAKEPLDVVGSCLLALATVLLLLGAVEGQGAGGTTRAVWLYLAGAALLLVLFAYERRIPHRILDQVLYRDRAVFVGNASTLLLQAAQQATLIPLTFYMQTALGYPTRTVGFLLALQPVFLGLASPLAGWYRDRKGAFLPILAGSVCCVVSMLFVALGEGITAAQIVLHLALSGIGMGLFQAINNAEIMAAAPGNKISLVGSMLALIRYFGMILGIGLAVWIAGGLGEGAAASPELTSSVKILFWLGALFCSGMAVLGLLRPRRSRSAAASGQTAAK